MVIDPQASPLVLQNIFFCLPSETGEAQGLTGAVARFSRMGPYFLQTPKCRGALLPSDEGADGNRHCRVFSFWLSMRKSCDGERGGRCWTRSVPFPWAGTVKLVEVPSERSRGCHIRAVPISPVEIVLLSFSWSVLEVSEMSIVVLVYMSCNCCL